MVCKSPPTAKATLTLPEKGLCEGLETVEDYSAQDLVGCAKESNAPVVVILFRICCERRG